MNRRHASLRRLGIRRGDIVLAASLLAFSAILGILFLFIQPEPKYVSVRLDGMEITRMPLNQDCRHSIGSGNMIEISGGSVRMIYADCPDKICVKTGSISRSGQSIVCAPHKLVVTIVGAEDNPSYDARTN